MMKIPIVMAHSSRRQTTQEHGSQVMSSTSQMIDHTDRRVIFDHRRGSQPNDDEDGITFITPLVPGHEACVSVTAVNGTGRPQTSMASLITMVTVTSIAIQMTPTGGVNGTPFSGGIANMPSGGVTDTSYCFAVPAGATFDGGETHFRFRLTSTPQMGRACE